MRAVKKALQWILCRLPSHQPPFDFLHRPIIMVKKLTLQSDLIECQSCKKRFVMNHSVKGILAWEDARHIYEDELKVL